MWRVKLRGESKYLSILAEQFKDCGICIQFEENTFWLCPQEQGSVTDKKKLYDDAEKQIEFLNISLNLYSNRYKTVESDGYYEQDKSGCFKEIFKAICSLSLPILVNTHHYGSPEKHSYDLYTEVPAVRYVMKLFNQQVPNWFDMYSIHETIESDEQLKSQFSAGIKAIKGWAKEGDTKRFLATANWHRHSDYYKSNTYKQPKPFRAMELYEAREYIRAIVLKWLEFKAIANDIMPN